MLPMTKVPPLYPGQWGILGSDSPLGVRHYPQGVAYYVDITNPNANDNNDGTDPNFPLLTLAAAYVKCTAGQNDVVFMICNTASYAPTATLTWAKDFTHLIGISPNIALGQRCRIVNTTANDLASLFVLSGSGCLVKNIQFFDGKDNAADGQCVTVTGNRNLFENCYFAGMGDATAGAPATRAGSYSLRVAGAENWFVNSTIGLDTVVRSAANHELIVAGPHNRFINCDIRAWSVTAGKFLARIDNTVADLRDIIFDDCWFFNYTPNWAAGITDAFNAPAAGNTYYVLLRRCALAGATGWANNLTHIFSADPAPANTFGIALNPAA